MKNVITSRNTRIRKVRENSGLYYCRAFNSRGPDYGQSNTIDINIKYKPSNVSVEYAADGGDFWEGTGYITIRCNADCNPACDRYQIYLNNTLKTTSPSRNTRIRKVRENSGLYYCKALNSRLDYVRSSNTAFITIKYQTIILESRLQNVSLRVNDDLPSSVSCRVECNFDDCHSDIDIIKDSRHVRTIPSSQSIFEKRKADISDSGTYYCRSGIRKSIKNITLTILYGPRQTRVTKYNGFMDFENIEEKKDETIPLLCSSTCNPPCGINWYKDGTVLSGETTEYFYMPRNRTMSGNYACKANGVEGNQTSDPVRVLVTFPPESVRIIPDEDIFYSKRDGKPYVDVVCKADCVPPCAYMWYSAYYRSSWRRQSYFTHGDTLFATRKFTYNRDRYFYCIVSNNLGSSYSKWITVSVKDGPENVTISPSQIPKENSPFSLVCSANCLHGCTSYRWSHGNKWLDEKKAKLTFNKLSKADNGVYTCSVEDYFGTKSTTYTVNVQFGPTSVTVRFSSRSGHLREGEDYIEVRCIAVCNPECSFQFYKNGQLVTNRDGLFSKGTWANRNMSGQYTCSAKNSIVNIYQNSSNFVDINIKYKPQVTFTFLEKIQPIIVPGSLNLTFRIDSFPPSNVTVYHIKDKLRTFQNMTGLHSFATPIMSCLDEGEYRVEAVNDVGSNSDSVSVDVLCSPIIINFVNVSDRGFKIGERLELTVAFKGNPKPEASWIFNPWKSNVSHSVQIQRIRNQPPDRTTVVIQTLNAIDFGIYKLRLKNNYGNISKDFKIQGPPTEPTDLYVECPGPAIVFWKPGFDGGSEQTFIIEYTSNQSLWQIHRPKSAAVFTDDYLKSLIDDISPNILYFFRIKASNPFGEATSESEVNCTRQNSIEEANILNIQYVSMGVGVMFLLLITIGILFAALALRRKQRRKNEDNRMSRNSNNSKENEEKDNTSGIVENILYISADEAKENPESSAYNVQNLESAKDANVSKEKTPENDNNESVYAEVSKSNKKQKPDVPVKPSIVKKGVRPNVNQDGLIYVELDLKDTAGSSTEKSVIHGAEDRTEYVDIDFTRRVGPPLDSHTKDENPLEQKEKDKQGEN